MIENERLVRVLLVDDELEFLNSTAKALRRRGFEITTVQNPVIGLKLLEHESFDVAVLDIKMPSIPGDQMFMEMKQHWPDTPVIILTGHGTADQALEISKEGIFEYLSKPCDIEKLAQACMDAVASSLDLDHVHRKPYDNERIHVLVVDDEADFLKSLSPVLQRRNMRVTTASGGLEALEKLECNYCDVVLLDWKMPGIDGMETLKRMKATHFNCEVILLTGKPTVASVVDALKEGARDYIAKPHDTEVLVKKIRDAYRCKKEKERELQNMKVAEVLSRSNG